MARDALAGTDARPVWLTALRRAGRFLLARPTPVKWGLCAGWMALLWTLSGQPMPVTEGGGPIWTVVANAGHAPLFGILGLLVCALVLAGRGTDTWRIGGREVSLVVGWVALYGTLDEWHQSRTPGRDPSSFDVLTDLVGAACVLWISAYVGGARATETGLRRRILAGIALCLVAALLASFGSS